jgi:hypothetical protein
MRQKDKGVEMGMDVDKDKMKPYAEVHVTFFSKESGGREKAVELDNRGYRPHFRVYGNSDYLGVEFVDGPEEPVQPGGSTHATVRFLYWPQVNYGLLVVGQEFEILEGPNLVGNGKVLRR